MRTMYDSITPSAIPQTAALVAGYVDGAYAWTATDWARFPNSVHVPIAVFASTNAGVVLDVETGDATPVQAPGWVQRRRANGVNPTVYCNATTWPAVQAAFASAAVPPPSYWIAQYDGHPALPTGAVAKQYTDPPGSGGNYDLSVVADYWPGVDQGGPPMSQPQATLDASTLLDWYITTPAKPAGTAGRQVYDVLGDGERILTAVAAVTAQLNDVATSVATALAALTGKVEALQVATLSGVAQVTVQLAPVTSNPAAG